MPTVDGLPRAIQMELLRISNRRKRRFTSTALMVPLLPAWHRAINARFVASAVRTDLLAARRVGRTAERVPAVSARIHAGPCQVGILATALRARGAVHGYHFSILNPDMLSKHAAIAALSSKGQHALTQTLNRSLTILGRCLNPDGTFSHQLRRH